MQRAAQQYLRTQVTTTSQGELVVMLYDGAIKFLNDAKERLTANDMAAKGIAISRALDIINELDSTLNLDKGGKLAQNLHSLYIFCSNHLVKANLKKDPVMIDDVLRVIGGLRSAYAEIVSWPEAQAAARQAAANMPVSAYMPLRPQAGTSGSGAKNPAPGAGVRRRNLYSQHATPSTPESAGGQIQAEQNKVEEAVLAQKASAPQVSADESAGVPSLETTPEGTMGVGFTRKAANLELYRKFAG